MWKYITESVRQSVFKTSVEEKARKNTHGEGRLRRVIMGSDF